MRAILVSVDYADLLAITLSYNRHHFGEVMVVTSHADKDSQQVARNNNAQVYTTNTFFDRGAMFNKWAALEEALDKYGRHGLMCIMDADVLWPKIIPETNYLPGYLYGPLRRMNKDVHSPVPGEVDWQRYRLHGNQTEWAGYTQIFHAKDDCLGHPPWHETNWTHAGGADSFFQRKWDAQHKIRTSWNVLHLGLAGRNWCGRITPYRDKTIPDSQQERARHLRKLIDNRRRTQTFEAEKLLPE